MLLWGDERIAVQVRVLVQERNCDLVFVDDVVPKLRVPLQQLADEAAAANLASDLFEVVRPLSAFHGRIVADLPCSPGGKFDAKVRGSADSLAPRIRGLSVQRSGTGVEPA
jgi:hypothetical protein